MCNDTCRNRHAARCTRPHIKRLDVNCAYYISTMYSTSSFWGFLFFKTKRITEYSKIVLDALLLLEHLAPSLYISACDTRFRSSSKIDSNRMGCLLLLLLPMLLLPACCVFTKETHPVIYRLYITVYRNIVYKYKFSLRHIAAEESKRQTEAI